jgi:DNA mismatch repair protein PMS2
VHKGYLALQRRETRTPEQDDVVLDTTSASWNKRSVQVTEDNDKDLEAPPRKKRRPNMSANALEVGGREVSCEAEGKERGKGKSSSRNRNDTRVKLREKLSEFARHGSQVANIDLDEDEESDKTISEGGQGEQEDVNVEVWEGRVKEEPTKMCRKGREKGIQPNEGASEIMDDVTMSADDNANHDAGQLPVGSGIPEKEKPASVTSPTADGSVSDASNDVSMLDIVGESGSSHSCESRPEIIRSVDRDNVFLRFDLSRISITWHQLKDRLAKPSSAEPSIAKAGVKILIDAGVTNTDDNDTAANALARVIDKEDFKLMDIVGQFNLGFIVARRRKLASSEGGGLASMMDDLFIIDQHAADEKYNFETLQQTTNIESQRLLR